jgi:hypothetical protein
MCATFSSNRWHSILFKKCTNVYHRVLSKTNVYFPKYMLMKALCNANGFCKVETEFLCVRLGKFWAPHCLKGVELNLVQDWKDVQNLQKICYCYLPFCTLFTDAIIDSRCTVSKGSIRVNTQLQTMRKEMVVS